MAQQTVDIGILTIRDEELVPEIWTGR